MEIGKTKEKKTNPKIFKKRKRMKEKLEWKYIGGKCLEKSTINKK